jgi:hypothetical protein
MLYHFIISRREIMHTSKEIFDKFVEFMEALHGASTAPGKPPRNCDIVVSPPIVILTYSEAVQDSLALSAIISRSPGRMNSDHGNIPAQHGLSNSLDSIDQSPPISYISSEVLILIFTFNLMVKQAKTWYRDLAQWSLFCRQWRDLVRENPSFFTHCDRQTSDAALS